MITNPPRKSSDESTFLLFAKGSINDPKKAPVERQARVTDTFEILMA